QTMSEKEERPPGKINKIWGQEFKERSRNILTGRENSKLSPFYSLKARTGDFTLCANLGRSRILGML
ncbi:MAG: hypothetical protein QME13_07480, partial [Thermoanaerobacteraceae bacterium]|nr:hypothetical protein [Thermoanaerobacteraceae bacterium]